jgi:hypothetical protein
VAGSSPSWDVWLYRFERLPRILSAVTWYLRALEVAPSRWLCKRGRSELDEHGSLDGAIAHLRELADTLDGDFEIVVHHLSGPTCVVRP